MGSVTEGWGLALDLNWDIAVSLEEKIRKNMKEQRCFEAVGSFLGSLHLMVCIFYSDQKHKLYIQIGFESSFTIHYFVKSLFLRL